MCPRAAVRLVPGRTVHADSLFLPEIYSGEKRQHDSSGTLEVSPGAPLWGVCSPTHARTLARTKVRRGTRSVKEIDPRAVESQNPIVPRSALDTMLHALGYRDTMVALLLVVVARPVDSVESTYFIVSRNLLFGSIRSVLCPRPLAEPASEPRFLASIQTSSTVEPQIAV